VIALLLWRTSVPQLPGADESVQLPNVTSGVKLPPLTVAPGEPAKSTYVRELPTAARYDASSK
jgi:hypothetical protein